MKQIFIDKFTVPVNARQEFLERMTLNRNIIRHLPGFNEDTVYERATENNASEYITVAVWENEDVLQKAKETVQAAYKTQGFDMPAMLRRLNISVDRGVYTIKYANNAQQNREIVRKLYEDCLNARNFELLETFVAEDYTGPNGEKGPSGFSDAIRPLIAAFPDIRWTVEDLIETGDKVAIKSSWQGTHTGNFRSFPASQRQVTDHAMAIYQFRDNKIEASWIQTDRLGFLQQIGIVPEDMGALLPTAK